MKLHPPSLLLGAVIAGLIAACIASWFWQHQPQQVAMPVTPPELPAATPQKNPAPAAKPDLVLDLFEPDAESLTAQHSEAALSSQIEHALVVSFVLTRCHLISQQEYADSYNALITYAASSHLAPDLPSAAVRVHEIAKSAGASYALVYSRVPCTDKSLPPLVASLRQWQHQSSSRTVIDNSSTP